MRALAVLAVAVASSGCGVTAATLLRTTEETKSTHPLAESDARVLCGQTPCSGVPMVTRESTGWRAPLFFGSLVDLTVGGTLLGRDGTAAHVGGYSFLVIGAIELVLQLSESFPRRTLDGPVTVLWRDGRIDLVDSDMPGMMYPGATVSIAEIVERRARRSPEQAAEPRKQ